MLDSLCVPVTVEIDRSKDSLDSVCHNPCGNDTALTRVADDVFVKRDFFADARQSIVVCLYLDGVIDDL